MATVRILRSTTAGNTPSSLVSGQIAINEGDGKLFYRNGAGAVTVLPTGSSLARYATTAGFPATGQEGVLYLSVDTSKIFRWESTAYVEVGAIATSASASDLLSGTLPDARLSSSIPTFTAVNKFLNFPSSGIDIYPRGEVTNASSAQTANQPYYAFFTPSATVSVSAITIGTAGTAGSGLTLARMALYTFDETTATLVARTANDTTLFNATNTTYTRSFDTTGGYPARYTLTAGTRYGVGVLSVGTTLPAYVVKNVNFGVGNMTPRLAAASTGASDLPTSTTVGNSNVNVFARLT